MLDSSNEVKALLVADLSTYTDKGGLVSAETGDITVNYSSIDAIGVSSNEDIELSDDSDFTE
jgi:hypothetical protein